MALSSFDLIVVFLLLPLAHSISIQRRQDSQSLLDQYTTQVQTAIYVIDSIQAGNASTSCADNSLPDELDASGYDGGYAQQLLCESAIGIQIFSDLDQAAVDMDATLQGLISVQTGDADDSSAACRSISVNTLDQAGLDGPGIRRLICDAASSTSTAISSITSKESSESSTITSTVSTSTSIAMTGPSGIAASQTPGTSAPITSDNITSSQISSIGSISTPSTTAMSPSSIANSTTQPTPSSTNSTIGSIAITTTIQTISITPPAFSSSIPRSTDQMIVTRTITSTSTLDVVLTVTVDDDLPTPGSRSENSNELGHRIDRLKPRPHIPPDQLDEPI